VAALGEELDVLMTAARERDDKEAFAQVVASCHHTIRAAILREAADPDLADEIAQEALVRAWDRRRQYRPGTSPRAWLLAIARSQLVEYHRKESRDRRHLRQLIREELLRRARELPEAESVLESASLRLEALKACLAELGPEQRELLDLVHGKGLTTEAAAEVLGIQPPACRQRLSRLQRALRQCAESRMARMAGGPA